MSPAEESGFEALAQRIAGTVGLDLGAYKDRCLRRRIAVRMRASGSHNYHEYLAYLDRTPGELECLLDALTINVTKFFRNRGTWTWLGEHALPELLARRQGSVRAWSAGCASGEEPYTMAMLIADGLEQLGRAGWLSRVRIDATDIDRESLERARAARYPRRAFDETPAGLLQRYCQADSEEQFEVAPGIRQVVSVLRHDLLRDLPAAPPYDLVICRNVIIYFDRETQERLMRAFISALDPGGYLVLGKVETILGPARADLELVEARERVYRKAG